MKILAGIGLAFIYLTAITLLAYWTYKCPNHVGWALGIMFWLGYYYNDIEKWFKNN